MDTAPNELTTQSSQQKGLHVITIVMWWSIALFLAFGLIAGFMLTAAPYVLMIIFPKGKFMGFVFSALPLILISLWCVGTILAYRRHGSWQVVMGLLLTGFVVVSTLPIWFYLTVLLLVGGWDVGK